MTLYVLLTYKPPFPTHKHIKDSRMIISFHSDIQHRIDDLLRPACLIQSVNAETEEESDQDLPPSQNSDAFDVISTHLSTDDLTAWRLFELAWWATKLVCSIKSFVILFYSILSLSLSALFVSFFIPSPLLFTLSISTVPPRLFILMHS